VDGGILQGSWGLGFALSSVAYWVLFDSIGWRGLLRLGILPAVVCIFIRYYVKEPEVWVENRKRQREQNREVRAPLFTIFKRSLLGNTLTACWWMASAFVVYYSIYALFATWLQKDLKLAAAVVATPILLSNLVGFVGMAFWGVLADRIGRRWSMVCGGTNLSARRRRELDHSRICHSGILRRGHWRAARLAPSLHEGCAGAEPGLRRGGASGNCNFLAEPPSPNV